VGPSDSAFRSTRGEVRIDPESHGLLETRDQTVRLVDGDRANGKVVGTLGVLGPSKHVG
jgi:hypothetical protein